MFLFVSFFGLFKDGIFWFLNFISGLISPLVVAMLGVVVDSLGLVGSGYLVSASGYLAVINAWVPLNLVAFFLFLYITTRITVLSFRLAIKLIPTLG